MTMIKGDFKEIAVTREDESSDRIPLAGHVVRFAIRNFEDGELLLGLTSDDPLEIYVPEIHSANPAEDDVGRAFVRIKPDQSAAFPVASLLYDLEVQQAGTVYKSTILKGHINVIQEIVR
jgi:hypothetical protein